MYMGASFCTCMSACVCMYVCMYACIHLYVYSSVFERCKYKVIDIDVNVPLTIILRGQYYVFVHMCTLLNNTKHNVNYYYTVKCSLSTTN